MKRYNIEELAVGKEEYFKVIVTGEMLTRFSEITGDKNPLHTDIVFAKEQGYKDRVAYGLLTGSFLSTLCGMYLPGERSLIQEMNVKFPNPVFIGDELTVSGKVEEVHKGIRQIVLKVEIKNQDGMKVLRGKMRVGLTDE